MTPDRSSPRPYLLFDWGDTLMRDDPRYDGPMASWPEVSAVPGAVEVLSALRPEYGLALATNAAASTEADIWAALERAELHRLLDRIYCFRTIGRQKPSRAFFDYILVDLQLPPWHVFMIGDSYASDVLGAVQAGIRAVWFNPYTGEDRSGKMVRTVHDLRDLPERLQDFPPVGRGSQWSFTQEVP